MTEIRLYHAVAGVAGFVALLVQDKLLPAGQRVAIHTASKTAADALDDRLWSLPREDSFIPHCLASDPFASRTPVVLTYPGDTPATVREVLVNLMPGMPANAVSYLHFITVLGDRIDGHADFAAALEELTGRGHQMRSFDMAGRGAA